MKIIQTLSILSLASLTFLSSVSLAAMSDDEFNKQLALLHSRAQMEDRISISAISQSVYKLVQERPSQLSEIVVSVLEQRDEWTEAELFSIVRAALIASPDAFNEVKAAAMSLDYEVLKKHGLSAATFSNTEILELWQKVTTMEEVSLSMFNIAFTQVGATAIGFAHETVYPLDVLDNLIYGERDLDGENPPIIPVIPPTTRSN